MVCRHASVYLVLLLVGYISANAIDITENQINVETRRINSGEELVSEVVDSCFIGDVDYNDCVRGKVLVYLDTIAPESRSVEGDDKDQVILKRVMRYLNSNEFKVQLPEFLFQKAQLTFRPAKGLANFKVSFPEDDTTVERSLSQARGILKKKLLLPIVLLLKLVMKALTPLFLLITSIKATKALILSKIAIAVVLGFVIMQVMAKKNMMMPMPMPELAPPMPYGPPPAAPMPYGAPPAAPMPYGAPSAPAAPAAPPSSYEPGWTPTDSGSSTGNGGPYARVWDSHQVAYSGYYNGNPQTSTQKQQTY